MADSNIASTIAWIALFVAIAALILAWSAFDRSGEDLMSDIEDGLVELQQETDEAINDFQQEQQQHLQ